MAFGRLVKYLSVGVSILTKDSYLKALCANFCAGLFFILSQSALADEIVVGGVKLPVTQLKSIDAENVKIVVGNRSEILSHKNAEILAVEEIFSDANLARRISPHDMAAIAATLANRSPASDKALLSVFAIWMSSVNTLESTQRSIAQREFLSSDAVAAFLNTIPISFFLQNQLGMDLLADLATRDPAAFSLRVSGLSEGVTDNLCSILEAKAISALALRDFDRASRSVRAMTSVRQSDRAKDLTIFVQRLREVIESSEGLASSSKLFQLVENTSDPALREVLIPFLVERVHKLAADYIANHNFGDALTVLAKIPPKKCTLSTHQMVQQSLAGLMPDAINVVLDRPVNRFLIQWSSIDKSLSVSLRAALVRLGESISKIDPATVSQLLALYPFTISDQDFLLRRQAEGLLDRGLTHGASDAISKISNYGVFDTLYFMAHGLYGGTFSLVCYALSVVLFIALIAVRFNNRVRGSASKSSTEYVSKNSSTSSSDDYQSDLNYSDVEGGFTISKARMMSPTALEYRRLLSTFNLDTSAQLKDIKQAYRTLVKSVHPDLNPNVTEENRAKFIELTQNYERLLALREEIGI